ncbi:MAG: P1 family peptidase [Aurantimonas endophytica]|uniref:DmpA family aminopeptidase n=1 Tax=Aurantimonas endophytica TaxID=1522175 RepID=UPI0030020084
MADSRGAQSSGARARDLGLGMPGEPGPLNAITDVRGVSVGMTTILGEEPCVRTGVTAILPRLPADLLHPVWAGFMAMNGNGEMTGTHWIREAGWFTGPICLTNTLSLGIAHHATARYMVSAFPSRIRRGLWVLPVVAETYDGYLNDIEGFHVGEDHVRQAIEQASTGAVAEGSVGGGTGMIAYEFKAGTGTASRRVDVDGEAFTVGALVQANHGLRPWLTVCGHPVGLEMPEHRLFAAERGSIIVVLATDAPLLSIQLERLARRAAIGIGRGGTPSGNNSGDLFLAFSTANDPGCLPEPARFRLDALAHDGLDPLFMAAVEAVEEAVLNALVAAGPMIGKDARFVAALDHDQLRHALRR